ncbi:metallophosphoesterase [uncultured Paraglaciecola sp.]|uniref:metallophosphoesterase family protein n=1 Tax=uncultured Paraglaciecola sp. TaxID=1765024 RepID=UPI0030DCBF76|tara:strand:+ start:246592 stop:247338 length:747 start_codon:yes stop_codon:yes gene_type:complete
MKIIQISDCHLLADTKKFGYQEINPFHSLQKILASVKQHKPDVLLVTGDISGDATRQSYQHFSGLLQDAKIDCRIAIIPGNHDNQEHLATNVHQEYLWLQHPQLVLPNHWHIHLLDTQSHATLGQLSQDKLHSLTDYVNQHSNEYHLLAAHHHPISCGGWMDKHQWLNRQEFNAVVAKNQAIKGVVYGHIHTAIEQQVNQCVYLACPSTCWQFATQASFATSDLKPGYRVINLLENGQISTSIHRLKE